MCLGAIYWRESNGFTSAVSPETRPRLGFDDSAIYGEITQPHAEPRNSHDSDDAEKKRWQLFGPGKETPGKIRY